MQSNLGTALSRTKTDATRQRDPVREEQAFHRDLVETFLAKSGLVEPHDTLERQSVA
jgi:hypothetical protein